MLLSLSSSRCQTFQSFPETFQPRGQTALYDAILLSFGKITSDNNNNNKVEQNVSNNFITIITDGIDNASQASREHVKECARNMWSQGVQGKFLGACGKAIEQGDAILGLSQDHVLEYEVAPDAVQSATQSLSASYLHYYTTGTSPAFSSAQRSAATPRRYPRQNNLSSRTTSFDDIDDLMNRTIRGSTFHQTMPQTPHRRHNQRSRMVSGGSGGVIDSGGIGGSSSGGDGSGSSGSSGGGDGGGSNSGGGGSSTTTTTPTTIEAFNRSFDAASTLQSLTRDSNVPG